MSASCLLRSCIERLSGHRHEIASPSADYAAERNISLARIQIPAWRVLERWNKEMEKGIEAVEEGDEEGDGAEEGGGVMLLYIGQGGRRGGRRKGQPPRRSTSATRAELSIAGTS